MTHENVVEVAFDKIDFITFIDYNTNNSYKIILLKQLKFF